MHICADILEVDIAFLVAVFVLFILSIVVAGKLCILIPARQLCCEPVLFLTASVCASVCVHNI